MKYDFTTIIDRRGKDALAVDSIGRHLWGSEPNGPQAGFDSIPMWVADMNFATCPSVTAAIRERLEHPLFGYFVPRDEYFHAIIRWHKTRNGAADLSRAHIGYENGVHGCISSVVDVLTQPGDRILVHSPVYLGFKMDIEGKGRVSVYSPLKQDENGIWRMDYADMDARLKENNIHLAILCSPHNPCGRVWERWELEKAMAVYAANDCYVICDEIWSDLIYPGHRHTPAQLVSDWAKEHVISLYSLSKTFNLAGMVASYHIIYSKYLRDRIDAFSRLTHYNEQNVLSMHALIGAYQPAGHEWVDEVCQVLAENARFACDFIRTRFPGVSAAMPEGTYMLFADCSEYCQRTGKTLDDVLQAGWRVGVGWQDGRAFEGPCHIRMNLASPMSRIREAFERMEKYVFTD